MDVLAVSGPGTVPISTVAAAVPIALLVGCMSCAGAFGASALLTGRSLLGDR